MLLSALSNADSLDCVFIVVVDLFVFYWLCINISILLEKKQ